MPTSVHIHASMTDFDRQRWNQLAGNHPFLRHEYLVALEETGCATTRSGWQATHVAVINAQGLQAAAPLYLKAHSFGEYVFDHAWADAFHRNGLDYYPKLLCAVPFTPVSGPRLLAQNDDDRAVLALAIIELAKQAGVSSAHVNFLGAEDARVLREAGFMLRQGLQFHWQNAAYADFASFLATMTHDKRKKLRQDLRRVADSGVSFRYLHGAEIHREDLDFFYRCYNNTYRDHGSTPYLNRDFFERLHVEMRTQLLLIVAERGGVPIACALNVVGGQTLYGRYWGSTEFISGLHFVTCYLKAIEYCIDQGLQMFEGGAQGEHKMARGLLATPTWSAHWIADQRFAAAIGDFLDRESSVMNDYRAELEAHTPFKRMPP